MSTTDNGGAIAIKGFNYQKACILLIMLHNHHKEGFEVIPEAGDDFEFYCEGKKVFVQVKGTQDLTLKKLTGNISDSIILKNLIPGSSENVRKIFLWNLNKTTKKDLKITNEENFINPIYKFSQDQKNEIVKSLKLSRDFIDRLEKQYIYITKFENNLEDAITYLQGEMINVGILSHNNRARIIINELFKEIDQRSEIVVKDGDFSIKKISNEYLTEVFITDRKMELFDKVLGNLELNSMTEYKIKTNKVKIPLLFQSVKNYLNQKIEKEKLFNTGKSDKEIIEEIKSMISANEDFNGDEIQKYVIAIDYYCNNIDYYCNAI